MQSGYVLLPHMCSEAKASNTSQAIGTAPELPSVLGEASVNY